MSTHTDIISETVREPGPWRLLAGRMLGHKGVVIGGAILILVILAALFAPLLAQHGPFQQSLADRLQPPFWMRGGSADYILGTDHLGRDYFSRLLYGARVSLLIGFTTALISGTIGTFLGIIAGYFGGRTDSVVMFLVTIKLSIPTILVALAIVQLVGGSLQTVILVLGFLLWHQFAVVTRATTMQIRGMDFITAAETVGCSTPRILATEVLPNVLNQVIVVLTLTMASAILIEAALSFLGVGVQPPTPSWGIMIAEGKQHLFFKPWLVMIPGVALLLVVLAINLLGDGLRDVTAPEKR
ncbi:MAG: ABC transporter permease [Marinovum sp.]|jgi:peptide/nickel transport system permease protein|nr:ABC transporter permease [Marinovum sp.]MBT7223500.1 ABC transporter permease [Marinovum sp.]